MLTSMDDRLPQPVFACTAAATPDAKKSSSFGSIRSGTEHHLVQSNVSFGHMTLEGADDTTTEGTCGSNDSRTNLLIEFIQLYFM